MNTPNLTTRTLAPKPWTPLLLAAPGCSWLLLAWLRPWAKAPQAWLHLNQKIVVLKPPPNAKSSTQAQSLYSATDFLPGNLETKPQKVVLWVAPGQAASGWEIETSKHVPHAAPPFRCSCASKDAPPPPTTLWWGWGHHTNDGRKRAWQHTLNPKP